MTAAGGAPLDKEPKPPKKGVKSKIFGVILVILGSLDLMLSWRGGLEISGFYVLLVLSGVAIFCMGAIRGSAGRRERGVNIDGHVGGH